MATARMTQVVDQLRKAALAPGAVALSDGRLLEAFVNRRDEGAFETLVRRHGPMVLGVCRRILRDRDDADDAFQATFLVLIRKASAVVPREMVGNWLYGVAYRTAQAARVAVARRRAKEKAVGRQEAKREDAESDWLPLLDRELNGLPMRYRAAVVLCELEGKSRREAARLLGIPEGTLSSRLATARRLLARRLRGKGIALTTAAIATALAPREANARVPVPLLRGTLQLARTMTTEGMAAAGTVSAPAMTLAEGVVKGMLLAKLKTGVGMVLLVAVLGLGAGIGGYHAWAGEEPQVKLNEGNYSITIGPIPEKPVQDTEMEQPSAQALPQPARVSMSDESVFVMVNKFIYEPVTSIRGYSKVVTSYTRQTVSEVAIFPMAKVQVYQADGSRLSAKRARERVQKPTLALAYPPGVSLDRRHLRFIKDGTLVFVLPPLETKAVLAPPPAATTVQPPSVGISVPPPAEPTAPLPALPPAPAAPVAVPPPSPILIQPPVVTSAKSREPGFGNSEEIGNQSPEIDKLIAEVRRLSEENQRLREKLQQSDVATYQVHTRHFKVPAKVTQPIPPSSKVAFWISADEGKTWRIGAETAIPGLKQSVFGFEFNAPADGVYWFNVQVLRDGEKPDLAKLKALPPAIKVRVDTRKEKPAPSAPADDQSSTKAHQAAERNAHIAAFYRRTGHPGTAAFYDELARCSKARG